MKLRTLPENDAKKAFVQIADLSENGSTNSFVFKAFKYADLDAVKS